MSEPSPAAPGAVPFVILDVFADRPFGGNQLAVLPEAEGLSDEAMAAIAREFNFSETTFVLPPADPANTARVRIFTPAGEIPFAGHPNVGTAVALAEQREIDGDALAFEEGAGLVRLRLVRDGEGRAVGAELTAPQPLSLGDAVPTAAVAAALSLGPAKVIDRRHPPRVASIGLPFVMVELADRAALEAARVDPAAFDAVPLLREVGAVHLHVAVEEEAFDLRTRMFAPNHGVPEDPATGSANGALAGLLASLDPTTDGTLTYRIAQGVEMGRPSRLLARVDKAGGEVEAIRIGGRAIPVMTGAITAWL